MPSISLAEGVKLKSILTKRIHELQEEIRRVAFVTVEKDEPALPGARTLELVEAELDAVRLDARTLDRLMYRANIDHTIEFQNQQVAIVEAIEWATQLRAKASLYKELASSDKKEIQFGYGDSNTFYRVALFDPETYRMKAIQAEKDAHQLSNRINAKNYAIQLSFDDSPYF